MVTAGEPFAFADPAGDTQSLGIAGRGECRAPSDARNPVEDGERFVMLAVVGGIRILRRPECELLQQFKRCGSRQRFAVGKVLGQASCRVEVPSFG